MDRIHYAGDSVLTGTAIAQALLGYARALAEVDESETVEIPSVAADGSVGRSTFLIGPASQLVSENEPGEHEEIEDEELVAWLLLQTELTTRRRTTTIATSQNPQDVEEATGLSDWDDALG